MAENTLIEWADHTFNPWIGCTKVGPGCDHCYAERLASTRLQLPWGQGAPRKHTSAKYWKQPLVWNVRAQRQGMRMRVFCASLADVFDNEVDPGWRDHLWALIRETPYLDWVLVTKRIGNAKWMLPEDWGAGYPNVWLLATVCNQGEADRDIPHLLDTPARVRGLSMEPLLGPVDLGFTNGLVHGCDAADYLLDWVIVGGESGPGARAMPSGWVISLCKECRENGVPFFFKQWGGSNKKVNGRLLYGRAFDEFPGVA